MGAVAVWFCAASVAFVLGCLLKAVKYARMPMHVRWELYPVAHEKGKPYGGSYFEEPEWWTRPREVSRAGEVKTIAEEVFTLRAVREHNRPLWIPSLLFHYGLYLLFALGVAVAAGGLSQAAGTGALRILAGSRLLSAWGGAGLLLATAGCTLLLARRLSQFELRRASTPADFFHLWLLLAVFVASIGSWLAADRSYGIAAGLVASVFSAHPEPALPTWFALQIALLGLFLAYLPWSHMTHFFAKYFTWHSVRWDDAPNTAGKTYAAQAARLLGRPVRWSGPHIQGDGKKTWGEIVKERGES
jgi:nitrate reductase gamma subunit